jgi:hypothetical protein
MEAIRRHEVPSAASAVRTLAAITLTRLGRSKAPWIGLVIAGVPVVYAVLAPGHMATPGVLFQVSMLILALLPAMLVGSSIGEELDDRTSTYLWSRPLPRWAVLVGKLCALTPIVIALALAGWIATIGVTGDAASLASCLALAAGATAASLIAAGIATVMPRHSMAMTLVYLLADSFIGVLPFSARELSITHQTAVLADLSDAPQALVTPLITMAIVSGVWLVIGLLRIRRLEV